MAEETRSTEEIERSLDGTRRRIEDRFTELSRKLHARTDPIPGWAVGAGAALLLFLFRRPLLLVLRSAAKASAPVVVPLVIGKLMERSRGAHRDYSSEGERAWSKDPFGDPAYGESAVGEGRAWRDPSYSP
jgi:hypothetical protein